MRQPLVVCYGMGVDSTAMLVGLHARSNRPDLVIFADVGVTVYKVGCNKHRYPDKKSAVSAINRRTRGHQRNRPAALRAYCCPACGGWHLSHQNKYED